MNRSIGVRAQSACFTLGGSDRCGWAKAQWPAYGAPAATQRFNTDFCAALNGFFNEGGGITSSGSSDRMRCINSLSTSLPGARISKAASRSSSRSLALRVLASGPWQVKQCVARIGRTSRLKSGASSAMLPIARSSKAPIPMNGLMR